MAESESIDCPCSNIAIMQLFHELKQTYPTIPDHVVSKVIQENYHDKSACETILRKESHAYLQSYPGAIISGNPREPQELGSLCDHCPASRVSQQSGVAAHPSQSSGRTSSTRPHKKQECAFLAAEGDNVCWREKADCKNSFSRKAEIGNSRHEGKPKLSFLAKQIKEAISSHPKAKRISTREATDSQSLLRDVENSSKESVSESGSEAEANGFDSSSVNSSRTCCSECEGEKGEIKSETSERSRSCGKPTSLKGAEYGEVETVRWNVEDGGRISGGSSGIIGRPVSSEETSVHNYQVAVQYSMQPALPLRHGGQQRSFTTVNLSLRPPSSEPQPPIEIQSGQNLTYTTSVFDAKKGVQSQLQIRIGPGGGGTVSACRTYISSPQTRFSCRSPCCTPHVSGGFQCQNNHHLKALLEKQRERKDLLSRELRKEKEKLRIMQSEIRAMKASIAQRPSPQLLPKLRSEIERLRAECERLTAAVDLYSNNLPLGETDEQFYRNIYTGQRLQREGSWSCQLCTFRNHPLLSVCEECEMPRISLGTQVVDVTSRLSVLPNNNNSFCTEGHPHPRHSSLPPFKNGEQLGSLDSRVTFTVNSFHEKGLNEPLREGLNAKAKRDKKGGISCLELCRQQLDELVRLKVPFMMRNFCSIIVDIQDEDLHENYY